MKQVFFRLIWTFWLLLLGSLLTIAQPNEKSSPSVTSVHCPPVIAALTFSYDEQNIPSVAYDTQPRTKFGYDVPLLHARGERGIWSAGGCALLVDLANGLAANRTLQVAQEGGRHAGFLKNYVGKSPAELQKGITSLQKQIAEHQGKIANPEKFIPNFKQLDLRQQKALLESKWPGDIQRQQEQANILRGLLGN